MKRTALAALLPLSLCWITAANAQQTQPPVSPNILQTQPPRITTVIDPAAPVPDDTRDQRLNNDQHRYRQPTPPENMRRGECRGSWRLFKLRLRCGI